AGLPALPLRDGGGAGLPPDLPAGQPLAFPLDHFGPRGQGLGHLLLEHAPHEPPRNPKGISRSGRSIIMPGARKRYLGCRPLLCHPPCRRPGPASRRARLAVWIAPPPSARQWPADRTAFQRVRRPVSPWGHVPDVLVVLGLAARLDAEQFGHL